MSTGKLIAQSARKNRYALIVAAAALVLAVVLLSLPLAEFSTSLFTKRSPNTFVGDEKYAAAMAETEAVFAQYESAGIGGSLVIDESVTERVNSKGETTSLVVLNVRHTVSRTGWDFLRGSLAPSRVIQLLVLCVALSIVLALLGTRGSLDALHRNLTGSPRRLRLAACWLALVALLLVPVFSMTLTHTFSRQVQLLVSGQYVAGVDALLRGIDAFLYNGAAGEQTATLVAGLQESTTTQLWLLLPVLAALLFALVMLYRGAIAPTAARGALYAFVIASSLLILYPFYVMFITAFRSNAETTDMYFLHMLPTKWVWSNLLDILDRGVLRYLMNSIALACGATAIAMLCGIPAAYAMARMKFRGKNVFLGFVIMSQMFSPVVLLVGISQLMNTLHLNDTIIGLMLINAAFNQAFAIWLLRGTFISISPEMEQAAQIDGCTTVGALLRILLPMAAPGIVTTLIFVFINAWNEYTISTVLISTPNNKPITVGITQFSSFNMIEWQYLFAAALLATIPVVILFMCIEKHLAAGLTSGGVKG